MTFVAAEECSSLNERSVFESFTVRETTLGKLAISRALPVRGRRMIGPWCFLDLYGPLSFTDDKPMDVAPHPHIGLQTVSWLFEGEVVHHDSVGGEGVARPGSVNVMTSGRGIAHSEETPRRNLGRLHGVQLWVALPAEERNIDPAFHPVDSVPVLEFKGGSAQLFMGTFGEAVCEAPAYSDLAGLDVKVHRGEAIELPADTGREFGVMVLEGEASFEQHPLPPGAIHYLGCGRSELNFRSSEGARLLVVGGKPLAEPILMWWNFVAGTADEIAQARQDWEAHRRFGEVTAYDGPRMPAPPLTRIAGANPAS